MQAVLAEVKSSLEAQIESGAAICLGLSGGMDSVVLLDALHRVDAKSRNPLSCVHIHHGLSPNADHWANFCEALCAQYEVPCQVRRVVVSGSGAGIEAAARDSRYAVYREMDAPWILQAHHADDAAETLLLRLTRGAGTRGLMGMPAVRRLDAKHQLLRPLLSVSRIELESYARAALLKWQQDESNADTRLDRNFVRHEVLPKIAQRFPSYRRNWLRTARHLATSQRLHDELAVLDVGVDPKALSLSRLRGLSTDRLQNALRYFFSRHDVAMPDTGFIDDLERKLRTCGPEASLGVRIDESFLYRHRDELMLVDAWRAAVPEPFMQLWKGEVQLDIPALRGTFAVVAAIGQGISAARTAEPVWTIRGQRDGERLQPRPGRPSRTLKNLFQEQNTPAWLRPWQPRLAHQGQLVWVAGLGVAADWHAAPGEPGLVPHWYPWSP